MISLAGRDILHSWSKFVLTGVGLGLLIGVTLTMTGVYRGMVDDARMLLANSRADLWVVQQDTQGPYAESSSLRDDTVRSILGLTGVAQAANVTYFTMQVRSGARDVRAMVVGFEPGQPGAPGFLVAGRHVTRSHYEAVADVATGFSLGERIRIRRHDYTVVGLTRRMVSSGGDPMVFIPLKDAQEAQFLKDNDAILNERERTAANPVFNRPGVPGLLEAVQASQASSRSVNAVLVQVQPGFSAEAVAEPIRRWKHLEAYTREQMEEILVAKLIATSARQIAMFLVILAVVSAAIVAFIIYTMTLGKIREIAVLKLIGTRNRTIAGMILQQALGLGLIGFVVAAPGIRIEGLRKRYGEGDTAVDALKGVDMVVAPGEVVGLIGPSGSGKSTLLKCLGAVIEPTAGRMILGNETIYDDGWKIPDLRALRRDRIGFVFQAPYLIPFLDVTDNVALLPMLAGRPNGQARQRAVELLGALDVAHRARAQPVELSGGEQQRVSIARALANRPPVILADEPTAPLDSERALAVMRILNQMAVQYHTAIIVVTHDEKIIPTFKRLYHIRDGKTYEEAGQGLVL
ncbi:MAG: ATP-binding cassette domain-containing protein [Betaproteobacteria bacterium]|nr:ATP-binding cassette domain-containing protein [Betaproteobacteria bacterium]